MSFYYANARQPEILRTIQKDEAYSEPIGQQLSDIARLINTRAWFKYNELFPLFGQLIYHGFNSYHNLQTLGEEYTGIIQIDSKYIALPNKYLQFVSILLEFGGELLFNKLLRSFERDIQRNEDLRSEAKEMILKLCETTRTLVPYLKALHKSIFYIYGNKYQISKRLLDINYVRVRQWLSADITVQGYRWLGFVTLAQLVLVFLVNFKKNMKIWNIKQKNITVEKKVSSLSYKSPTNSQTTDGKKCVLCLESRKQTSATLCGHLFCWPCIMEWLDQKQECPVCRESVKHSNVVLLQNFF